MTKVTYSPITVSAVIRVFLGAGEADAGGEDAMIRHLYLGTWVARSEWCNRPIACGRFFVFGTD